MKPIVWKLIILVALLLGLYLVTLNVGDVRSFASGLMTTTKLPIWLVGLLAPILFVLQGIGKLLGSLFNSGSPEREIADSNAAIRQELIDIRQTVRDIDAWRAQQLQIHREAIARIQHSVTSMEKKLPALDAEIALLKPRINNPFTTTPEDPG